MNATGLQHHVGIANSPANIAVACAPYDDSNAAFGLHVPAAGAFSASPNHSSNSSSNNSNNIPLGVAVGSGVVSLAPQHHLPQQPMLGNHMGEMTAMMLQHQPQHQQLQQHQQSQLQQHQPPQLQQTLHCSTMIPDQAQHLAPVIAPPVISHLPINPIVTAAAADSLPLQVNPLLNTTTYPAMTAACGGGLPTVPNMPSSTSPIISAVAPASQAPSSSSSPSSSSMCSLNNALVSTDDSGTVTTTPDYTASGYTAAPATLQPLTPSHCNQTPTTPSSAMSDDEITRSVSAAAAEAAAALSYNEAREKQRQEKKERHATKKLIKELAVCKAMLEGMELHEDSWPFLLPVNTKQFPTYKKIIKSPMDLSTIKKRIHDLVYKSRDDFIADVRLIFDNCEIFNEDDSPVGKAGHGMRKYFEVRWAELTDKHSS